MPLQVKQFNCPNCGSPLDIKNVGYSKTIVCPTCNSQIDLTGAEYQVIGTVGSRPRPKLTPFELGMKGTIEGEQHEVIGRVRYRDDEGEVWDEWLLLTASGDYRWISDDEEEGMVLWHSFTPTQPLDPNTVREGHTIDLGDGAARVRERGDATIDYLEGELTWKATIGDTMQYLDAEGTGILYSIEWTKDEIEFWKGKRLSRKDVEQAFGMAGTAAAIGASTGRAGAFSGIAGLAIAIACLLLLCVIVASLSNTSSESLGEELVCNTPSAPGAAVLATPTASSFAFTTSTPSFGPTATPPPNCFYRPRSGGSGFFGFFSGPSIRSGSPGGRGFSGGGK